jgi:hypothetical protein
MKSGANLQGANLDRARLQGANLNGALLQGASLDGADLAGANLEFAQLQGADLASARLQGARLAAASLEAADLNESDLRGAVFSGNDLRGASFFGAQLQGANLENSSADGASFWSAFVWRSVPPAAKGRILVVDATLEPKTRCYPDTKRSNELCAWSDELLGYMAQDVGARILKGDSRDNAVALIMAAPLDPANPPRMSDRWAEGWQMLEESIPAFDKFFYLEARQWARAGCDPAGGPYVIPALRRRMGLMGEKLMAYRAVAATFLNARHCAGARGLGEKDKAELQRILDNGMRAVRP